MVLGRRVVRCVWLLVLGGCVWPRPHWQRELQPALSSARHEKRDLVVLFASPNLGASARALGDPVVLDALAAGGFDAVVADAHSERRRHDEWIGGGDRIGIAVLDGEGRCYAARPGPPDALELAALLRECVDNRAEIAVLRGMLGHGVVAPVDQHQLGCILLRLGCHVHCEPLLLDAAAAGVADAKHRLARLYASVGHVAKARRWLENAPETPAAICTEGYVLFAERRYTDAARTFERALALELPVDERQRALLYLARALLEDEHHCDRALPILEALAAEGTGSTFEAAAARTLRQRRDRRCHRRRS